MVYLLDYFKGLFSPKMASLPWVIMVNPDDFHLCGRVVRDIESSVTLDETSLIYSPFSYMWFTILSTLQG